MHPEKQHHRMCSAWLCVWLSLQNCLSEPLVQSLPGETGEAPFFKKSWTPSVSEKHRGTFTEPLSSLGTLPGVSRAAVTAQEAAGGSGTRAASRAQRGLRHRRRWEAPLSTGPQVLTSPLFPHWTQTTWKISAFSILRLSSEIQFLSPVSEIFVRVLHVIKALHKITSFWIWIRAEVFAALLMSRAVSCFPFSNLPLPWVLTVGLRKWNWNVYGLIFLLKWMLLSLAHFSLLRSPQ